MKKQKVVKAWAVMQDGKIKCFGPASYAILGRKENAALFTDYDEVMPVQILFQPYGPATKKRK